MQILRSLYQSGNSPFVIGDYSTRASVNLEAGSKKIKSESLAGLDLSVSVNGQPQQTLIVGRKGDEGKPSIVNFGDTQIAISYGSKNLTLPFSLKCRDFILERFPGTDNPSSYASEVTLIDAENGVNRDQRIFMNNVLDHSRGYRFFQSSYDPDELGTYLSVNYDFWGTWISYIGYALLTIGLILTFFIKNSRFTSLMNKLNDLQQPNLKSVLVLFISLSYYFRVSQVPIINIDHAKKFGELIVQDHRGRFKPVNTICSEVLRKVAKKESINDLTSEQIVLSMLIDPVNWEKQPFINVGSHPEVSRLLNTQEKLVPYKLFFEDNGQYKLRDQVRDSRGNEPKRSGNIGKNND